MPFDLGDATLFENLARALDIVQNTAYIWLPLATLVACFKMWVNYRREVYWAKLGSVVLELKLPKEIYKSPLAMELVLNQLHQTADEGNWYWKYWRGQTRSWFSLEIASFGGQIHFYIWCRKKYQNGIEAHLYSQYPGIEIYEVPDYTKDFHFNPAQQKMHANQWILTEADPYPISTYVDYKLDKDPDEEYKIDPMTSQLEFLGTLKPGHTLWIQIIVRAHKKEQRKPGTWFEKTDAWKDEAKKEVDAIIEKFRPKDGPVRMPTEGEKTKIDALERSIGKYPFDVTIRSMYFANKDIFDSIYLGGMLGSFKQYGALGFNGFKPSGWHSNFDGVPYDFWKTDPGKLGVMIMEEYKKRSFFYSPYRGRWFYTKPIVLNAEELATIYHLPGSIAATPTLERIPSKKSQAPANLPL